MKVFGFDVLVSVKVPELLMPVPVLAKFSVRMEALAQEGIRKMLVPVQATRQRHLADTRFYDSGLSMDSWLLKGAVKPNSGVTEGALRAGRYLRYGGKILVPLGIATSAYAVYEALKGEKLKTAGVEGASWAGGAIASEGVVAALLVLAPETGGLSLLGIALVAGIGGGMFSGWGAHKLLFSNHPHAQSSVEPNGTLPAHMVQTIMPPPPAGQHR